MKSNLSRWTILNIVLFSLGIGLGAAHYPIDFDGLRCPTYEGDTLGECFQFGAFLGLMTGIVIGLGQAFFLSRQLAWGRKQMISWVAVTAAAFSLGHALGDSVPVPQRLPWSALSMGLVSGFMLGGLQWLVLRNMVAQATRWLWQSIVGFGVGLALVGVAANFLLDSNRNSVFGWNGLVDLMISGALYGLLVGCIWATLTGRTVFSKKSSSR
jgi:hypothetical protein